MARKKRNRIVENIRLEDYATEGKAIGRKEGKVYFVENGVPGDLVDIFVMKNKKDYAKAKVHRLIEPSVKRIEPFCSHFEWCGGCKWQFLDYEKQLNYKQQIVTNTLKHIGKLDLPKALPIAGAKPTTYYRNKMEYSFSHTRWLTPQEIESEEIIEQQPSLGMHVPGFYDKIVDIQHCYLQDDTANKIRNSVKSYALQNGFSFFNIPKKEGLLRTMFIRNTTLNEWMVIINYYENDPEKIIQLLGHLEENFPQITSYHYVNNSKANDTILDLPITCWKGKGYINEKLGDLIFKISPKSFFQTNSYQAKTLYDIILKFADLKPTDLVYDLYSGTGTIGLYLAKHCKQVIGIESVADAVADAHINKENNQIKNAEFYTGEVRLLFEEVSQKHGRADVVIVDPPRAGLHKTAVSLLLKTKASKIIYVSCNPATQARDLGLMAHQYDIKQYQPIDMFPHTYHIENVVELVLKG